MPDIAFNFDPFALTLVSVALLSSLFPESRSVGAWIWNGSHIAVAYVLGFLALLAILGWHPGNLDAPNRAYADVQIELSDCDSPGSRRADCAPQ